MTTGIPRQMRALKLWRRAGEALIADGFVILDARASGANHLLITVAQDGRQTCVSMSRTPRDPDPIPGKVVRDARRRIAECRR